jgi:hypothetical protein
VVIYRPTLNKEEWNDGGTRSEYNYANDTGKPVLVIRDVVDAGFDKPPFNTGSNPFNVLHFENLSTPEGQDLALQQAAEKVRAKVVESLK